MIISVLITIKFLIGGFAITFAKWNMTLQPLTGSDYAVAVAPWVALFMGHFYIGQRWSNGGDSKG